MREPKVTTVFIGFGQHAAEAASVMLRRKRDPRSMHTFAIDPTERKRARDLGIAVSQLETFPPGPTVRLVLIDHFDAELQVGLVHAAKAAMPRSNIVVVADQPDLRESLTAAGATNVFCPAKIAGQLIVETILPREHEGTPH